MPMSGTDWLEVPIPYIFGLLFRLKKIREYPHNSYGIIWYIYVPPLSRIQFRSPIELIMEMFFYHLRMG